MRLSHFTAALACAALTGLAAVPTTLAWSPRPIFGTSESNLPPVMTDGVATWRTFASNDTRTMLFNISTHAPPKGMSTVDGKGMYGWNFYFRGAAFNASRPLLIAFGSSVTRCGDISDVVCVLNLGASEAFAERIALQGGWAKAILDPTQAGMGVLTIVTPRNYNTTTKSPIGTVYGRQAGNHVLRHYRPELVLDILNEVQSSFGFDTNKVVGAGTSMGARGMLRFITSYPSMRAASIVAGGLEGSGSRTMQALPFNSGNTGEGCWNLTIPNSQDAKCNLRTPATMPLAAQFATVKVQMYGSPGDAVANLSTVVKPTCNAINAAKTTGSCVLRLITRVSASNPAAPNHNQLSAFGADPADLNFLIAGYGGRKITVTTKTNITLTAPSISDVGYGSTSAASTSTAFLVPTTTDATAVAPTGTTSTTTDPIAPAPPTSPTDGSVPTATDPPAPVSSPTPTPTPDPTSDSPAPAPPASTDGTGSGTGSVDNGSNPPPAGN
ncbi:hypothetical protein OC842_007349 [Tilletia horrida]|uniref:Feruloyl esterase n=1 Tax=Tilletia horrida TaxID=155126 RepID=A0AAN6G4D7_9BASI|nr:hypothetical protein OC842_007349 [Tilletia horrida]